MRTATRLNHAIGAGMLALCIGLSAPTQAAPLSLSNIPLFLGTSATPNVMLLIDDSGSMDWEITSKDFDTDLLFFSSQPDGSTPPGTSFKQRDGSPNGDGTADCTHLTPSARASAGLRDGYAYGVEFGSNQYSDDGNDCNTADDEAWQFRNSDFNPLYFNPNVTSKPWPGLRKDGTPFGAISITNAPDDPYDPATAAFINLTTHNSNWLGGTSRQTGDRNGDGSPDGFRYYTWTDDGDGIFENGEKTEHQIKNESAAVQQNFANWFSYYRKREYTAKGAYGRVIADAKGVRMGLNTLHNNSGTSRIAIADINDDPTTGNKKALLDALYGLQARNGTPLQQRTLDTCKYLSCESLTSAPFTVCPQLTAAAGGNCQQNFLLAMTDGFYNGTFGGISNKDGDNNTTFDGGAYADTRSDTLGDIAMHYYERDLHPGLADKLAVLPGVDEAKHQHIVSYGIAFGIPSLLTANPPNPTDPFVWPDPFHTSPVLRDKGRVDDLRHMAYNGRGKYLSAARPEELIQALTDALQDVADRTGAASAVAINTTSLQSDTMVFQARFNSKDWSGELRAFKINLDGTLASSPTWNAKDTLNLQAPNARSILTLGVTGSGQPDGVPFQWANLTATQQAQLNDDPDTPATDNDSEGQERLNWLRGDKTNEGTLKNYRTRSTKLGDLIDSPPFFVGEPNFDYPDAFPAPFSIGQPYSSFASANKDRTKVVYIGGNDGMLHAFNHNTGSELLAYVPNEVFGNLARLTSPSYVHRYYVDGPVVAGDAYANNQWRTVLLGALNGGGQGVFALDVSKPGTFNESAADKIVLWEFADADDADLGYTHGRPAVVPMANGKFAAVFGNGYNNTEADGKASTTGHGVLFIAFIEEGMDGVWTPTSDYIKLDTGVGDSTTPNGLSSPAPVDVDGDRIVDYIYAGDLRGNLWKFDVRSDKPGDWSSFYTSGGAPKALFTAPPDPFSVPPNKPQPITTRPRVGFHPDGEGGFMVYFGTGKYLETTDTNTVGEATQSYYGIWDKDPDKDPSNTNFTFSGLPEKKHLLQQEISEVDAKFDTNGDGTLDTTLKVRLATAHPIKWHNNELSTPLPAVFNCRYDPVSATPPNNPNCTHMGWFTDLKVTGSSSNFGERQVSDSQLRPGRVIFTTILPSQDPCDFGGNGWLMELNSQNGGVPTFSPFDLNGDGFFNNKDYVDLDNDKKGDAVAAGLKFEGGLGSAPTYLRGDQTGAAGGGGGGGSGAGGQDFKVINLSNGQIRVVPNNPKQGEEFRQSWRILR